jgi:hypothetical protein
MTFSDAIPVQFWLIDCDTYNESEPYGINHKCFCAPWECDDEIKIQFQDEDDQNFVLLIYDDEDSLLDSIPIEETEDGVYLTSFTPSDNTPGFCDKKIQLQIRKEAGSQGVTLPDLSTWQNDGGAGTPWSLGATPSINTTILGTTSERLYADFAFIVGVEYTIIINFTNTANTPGSFGVTVSDSSFNAQFSSNKSGADAGANQSTPLTFTATADTTRVYISLTFLGSTNTTTITSTEATRSVGSPTLMAKSDCLDIKESHEGTLLITYSNHRNYAGIINSNGSPELTFYLRIPAIFNEERFPETDEPMQLSNNRIISLNSQVKKQRLLETDQMPNYMHLKVKEVLKHQFVTIDETDYVKEEAYEMVENTNKRWPFRRYTCWLTEKEYVVRNIL